MSDHVLLVLLNRPEAHNAYNAVMGAELTSVLRRADADDDVRVVLLTAHGKVFCVGADMSGGAASIDTMSCEGAGNFGGVSSEIEAPDFVAAMFGCRKPIIVAFNGDAVGVGFTLALPADIRIAASTARFGFVFARRGLVPEAGSAWLLPRIVGLGQALRRCLTGSVFGAAEALEKGLVSEICAPDELLPRAHALATEIATRCGPVALALTRQLLWRFSGASDPFDLMRVDGRLALEQGVSPDVREGVGSFLEKRAPQFPGKVSADMPPSYPWWSE